MGARLAEEALERGHQVTVVSGPGVEPWPSAARLIRVEQARQMERALRQQAKSADAILMAAAVADFHSAHPASTKWTRRRALTLRLVPTPDIIARLPRRARQLVVGFAVETDRIVARATRKLRAKRLDLLIAQQANGTRSPFGRTPVRAWLLERSGRVTPLGMRSKTAIARLLLDKVEALWYGQSQRWHT